MGESPLPAVTACVEVSGRLFMRSHLRAVLIGSALATLIGCGTADETTYNTGSASSSAAVPGLGAALPATEVENAFEDGPLNQRQAFRLVEQSTYGFRMEDLNRAAEGANAWIDYQMQQPVTWLLPTFRSIDSGLWNEHVNAWWRNSIEADDQLRQRVAFALSEIFVVSGTNGLGGHREGLANFYDIFLKNAFGNYRTLLEEVTLNPIMGEYLSMKGNHKPVPEENIRPDENYAREVLQLFSIGLVQLAPDGTPILDEDGIGVPTYTQETIEAFAHVFTGWHFANADHFRWPKKEDYMSPMEPWEAFHDKGSKALLNGFVVPAGQDARTDLDMALNNIFNHPNVGPFISEQLIQRLVTSNPTRQYVQDVAAVFNSNRNGERGNLGSVIKAILMHQEAREGHERSPDTFGKLKEPLLRMTQLWRAFQPTRIQKEFNYSWAANELGQAPFQSPSVFNFFRPDYSHPGPIADADLVSPEFEIHNESSIIAITNRLLHSSIWGHNYKADLHSQNIAIDITDEMQLEPDHNALIDHLDLLLLGRRMSDELRAEVQQLMSERNGEGNASLRVAEAIFLIMSSAEAAVQK